MFACFAPCHISFVFPWGAEGTVALGMLPGGCEDTVARRWSLFKGGGICFEADVGGCSQNSTQWKPM